MPSLLIAGVLITSGAASTDHAVDHMNPLLPVDTRVAALLAKMSNREKAAQTVLFTAWQNNASAYAKALALYSSTGIGALSGEACDDQNCTRLAYQNAAQAAIINSSRLHIPASFICETLHSADGISTIFPMPCLQGATWDTGLVRAVATSIATQARAGGVDRGFSPEINVCTDPRFGRTGALSVCVCVCVCVCLCVCLDFALLQGVCALLLTVLAVPEENFGEDPALVAAMGVAAVTGLHGGNTAGASSYLPRGAIVSEAKHAAAYGFGGRDGAPADLSPRTLHDVYFRPWKEYVAAGGRGAMMSHNSINDVPAHMNAELMGFLRRSGGEASAGMLIASDECDVANLEAVQDGARGFGMAANISHAGALAMTAGLDQEFCYNGANANLAAFVDAENLVHTGMIEQSVLDRAAANVLRAKFVSPLPWFYMLIRALCMV
jgi:beta-glucosidase